MPDLIIDRERDPELYLRFDGFRIPAESRDAFETAMQRNLEFISTLDGFRGHTVLDRSDGDDSFDLITIAAWESRAALEAAKAQVMAHYRRIGFDLPGALRRWGVTMTRVDGPAR